MTSALVLEIVTTFAVGEKRKPTLVTVTGPVMFGPTTKEILVESAERLVITTGAPVAKVTAEVCEKTAVACAVTVTVSPDCVAALPWLKLAT